MSKIRFVVHSDKMNSSTIQMRLFCFHPAGGDGLLYKDWHESLPNSIEVVSVELPGRATSDADKSYVDFGTLINALYSKIEPMLTMPYSFFGHSLGVGISVVLAQEILNKTSSVPDFLFISGFAAPKYWKNMDVMVKQSMNKANIIPTSTLYYDLKLLSTLDQTAISRLPIKMVCFSADNDLVVPCHFMLDWTSTASSSFNFHRVHGDHRYLEYNASSVIPFIKFYLEFNATQHVPQLACKQDLLNFHKEFFMKFPASCTGSLYLYDLCWIVRLSNPSEQTTPMYPELLTILIKKIRYFISNINQISHPFCGFIVLLVYVNTILKWSDFIHSLRNEISHALSVCIETHKRIDTVNLSQYGNYFKFSNFYGRKLMTEFEVNLLLKIGDSYLGQQDRQYFLDMIKVGSQITLSSVDNYDYSQVFSKDLIKIIFGEFFPEPIIKSAMTKSVIRYAVGKNNSSTGSVNIAFLSKYADITVDPVAYKAINTYLERSDEGLRPGTRMQEVHFSLMYLVKAGVDVKHHFPNELDYFKRSLRKNGVGLEFGEAWPMDCDASAVAQFVANALFIDSPMATTFLETCWNSNTFSYLAPDGSYTYSLSTALHVLDAYLSATDVSQEKKQIVWDRVIKLLKNRPWLEIFHLSPFYIWEKIVNIIGEHAHEFEHGNNEIPKKALDLILSQQSTDGGFKSCGFNQSNLEETALALLALKSALASHYLINDKEIVLNAAKKAEQYIMYTIHQNGFLLESNPDFWVAKLTAKPQNIIRSIVMASLYKKLL